MEGDKNERKKEKQNKQMKKDINGNIRKSKKSRRKPFKSQ